MLWLWQDSIKRSWPSKLSFTVWVGLIKLRGARWRLSFSRCVSAFIQEKTMQGASFKDRRSRITGRRLWDLCMPHPKACCGLFGLFFFFPSKSKAQLWLYEFDKLKLIDCLCITPGQTYFNFGSCQSHPLNLRGMSEGSLTGETVAVVVVVVACGWKGRVRLMKEPGSDQRRENEMAFDLVGRRRVTCCHRSAK